MNPFDVTVFQWFNRLAGKTYIFDVGGNLIVDYATIIFVGLFAFYFFFHRGQTTRMRRTILLAVLAGALAVMLSDMITSEVYRRRPGIVLDEDQVKAMITYGDDSSFPSVETALTAALAVGMWGAPGRTARWVFMLIAAFVGVTRLIGGINWPTDVLAAVILGGLSFLAVHKLARPLFSDW